MQPHAYETERAADESSEKEEDDEFHEMERSCVNGTSSSLLESYRSAPAVAICKTQLSVAATSEQSSHLLMCDDSDDDDDEEEEDHKCPGESKELELDQGDIVTQTLNKEICTDIQRAVNYCVYDTTASVRSTKSGLNGGLTLKQQQQGLEHVTALSKQSGLLSARQKRRSRNATFRIYRIINNVCMFMIFVLTLGSMFNIVSVRFE